MKTASLQHFQLLVQVKFPMIFLDLSTLTYDFLIIEAQGSLILPFFLHSQSSQIIYTSNEECLCMFLLTSRYYTDKNKQTNKQKFICDVTID